MENNQNVVVAIFFIICGLCIYLSSTIALSQPSGVTLQPAVSLPAYVLEGPIPGGYITGYILDEARNPVPNATVSLLQDGELWKPDKYSYPRLPYGVNPQTTRVAYHDTEGFLREGSFLFGLPIPLPDPENYTLFAEKDGHNGSASIHVGRDTRVITVNITLSGYHQHVFTPEQLSYTGAIVGNLSGAYGGPAMAYVNISLWQDGRMVNSPDNPQLTADWNYSGKHVEYLFQHVAPGRYTVRADYVFPHPYNDTVSVDVGTSTVTADIVLSQVIHDWPSRPPTQVTSPSLSSKPTPSLPGLVALLVIGFVIYYIANKK